LIDLHTHILPAVDDGPDTVEESLALATAMAGLGFTRIFLTPHWPGFAPRGMTVAEVGADLEGRAAAFADRASTAVPAVRFFPGAEFSLDEQLPAWCAGRPGMGRFVLVDACFGVLPRDPGRLVRPLRKAGLTVLLVHPERCPDLRPGGEALASFAEGAALVGNLGSLSGLYRRGARDAARELLDRGLYWAFASDVHSLDQVPFIEKGM
jgi:protein-tyrosine phosphatase